ncbi:MAG: DUF3536 domain-containing protein [Candidatus Eisenbacteria bacterium]
MLHGGSARRGPRPKNPLEESPAVIAVLHGHFYQPPRENPWTDAVPRQASARPYHDWNERINDECYRANAWSRVLGAGGHIAGIVNNYRYLSFDFGPTLLRDLARRQPETYARILEADRASAADHGGHGNAIAQAYNHTILPLTSDRDKVTQVRWGMRDFAFRFGRKSEGLWLPETAIDARTLAVLAAEGVRFIILAPHQARRIRGLGGGPWHEVLGKPFDLGRAYRAYVPVHLAGPGLTPLPARTRGRGDLPIAREATRSTTGGSSIGGDGAGIAPDRRPFVDVFFYDGELAGAVSFHHLLRRAEDLADRLEGAARAQHTNLVHLATDGEVYGHHERFADMCLAYFGEHEAPRHGITLTNYGEVLEQHPPEFEVELNYGDGEGTAWSCAHGVGRWVRDCGCTTYAQQGWNQSWRGPLRAGLDAVRDEIQRAFESVTAPLLRDPWEARNGYIDLLLEPTAAARKAFLKTHAARSLKAEERTRVWTLLEASHQAMLMYTSCAWFFADISGIETRQNLAYAARAIELAQPYTPMSLETVLLDHLTHARSNLPRWGDGAALYRAGLKRRLAPEVVAARAAFESIFFGRPLEREVHRLRVSGEIERTLLDPARPESGRGESTRGRTIQTSSHWSGSVSLADDSLERAWQWALEVREGKDGGREIVLTQDGQRTVIPLRGILRRLPPDLRRETGRELQEILLRETRVWIEQLHDVPRRILPELSAEVSPFFRSLEQTVRRWELSELAAELEVETALAPDWWTRLRSLLRVGARPRLRTQLDRLGLALAGRAERNLIAATTAAPESAFKLVAEACDLLERADRVSIAVPRPRFEERAFELVQKIDRCEEVGDGRAGRRRLDASTWGRPEILRLAQLANLDLETIHPPATRSA